MTHSHMDMTHSYMHMAHACIEGVPCGLYSHLYSQTHGTKRDMTYSNMNMTHSHMEITHSHMRMTQSYYGHDSFMQRVPSCLYCCAGNRNKTHSCLDVTHSQMGMTHSWMDMSHVYMDMPHLYGEYRVASTVAPQNRHVTHSYLDVTHLQMRMTRSCMDMTHLHIWIWLVYIGSTVLPVLLHPKNET